MMRLEVRRSVGSCDVNCLGRERVSSESAGCTVAEAWKLMVAGGMPPMRAIQSATLEAARLLRIQDRLGTIEESKIADLVAVKGNPLEDIRLLLSVAFVMKEGVPYKHP